MTSPIKYIKPKFASNIHEAMRIMKIRKQLAKLERQNQLALTNVPVVSESIVDVKVQQNLTESKEKGMFICNYVEFLICVNCIFS